MWHETHAYTIQLPVFEGPLDLLLRLIEREELAITSVALAQVADQYLAAVRAMEQPDPAALSLFLVLASRLMQIKSRALLPRPPADTEALPPDEAALLQQLYEYQQLKQVAAWLRIRDTEGNRMYTRTAPTSPLPPAPALEMTLADLLAAMHRRLQLQQPDTPPHLPLPMPRTITVQAMAERVTLLVQERERVLFHELFAADAPKIEIAVALWATLELVRRQQIQLDQPQLFGPITIERGVHMVAARHHEQV